MSEVVWFGQGIKLAQVWEMSSFLGVCIRRFARTACACLPPPAEKDAAVIEWRLPSCLFAISSCKIY